MISSTPTYTIFRSYAYGPPKNIKGGLTLEEAQAHCSSPTTEGEGWADKYRPETEQDQRRRARLRR